MKLIIWARVWVIITIILALIMTALTINANMGAYDHLLNAVTGRGDLIVWLMLITLTTYAFVFSSSLNLRDANINAK